MAPSKQGAAPRSQLRQSVNLKLAHAQESHSVQLPPYHRRKDLDCKGKPAHSKANAKCPDPGSLKESGMHIEHTHCVWMLKLCPLISTNYSQEQ